MGPQEIESALERIAHEIASSPAHPNGASLDSIVILGIPSRGAPLANRIAKHLTAIEPTFDAEAQTGQLDVTMYRDDLRNQPTRTLKLTQTPAIDHKTVVLVDDVLFSGRTIRAALDALNDLGRPAAVRLAVLVDRGHRQLPISPDFVGNTLSTMPEQRVKVLLTETDGTDAVVIEG